MSTKPDTGVQKSPACPEAMARADELPLKLRDFAKELLAAGMDWQTVLAVLVSHGPELIALGRQAADLLRRLIDEFKARPVAAAAAGSHCPEHLARIKENTLCTLCCVLCLEHEQERH